MRKFLKNTFLASLLTFSILTPNFASALQIDTVLYQWDQVANSKLGTVMTERHQYKDITFVNGYTYTESYTNTTKTVDILLGNVRHTYTRTYRTY